MRSGEQLRVDVKLIQASDATELWANSYIRKAADVLRVQSEVSEDVARQIPANLHLAALPEPPSIAPRAHDAYLKATLFWNNRSDLQKSAALFQEAIKEQPDYALAYAGLADVYSALGEAPYDVLLPREARLKAKAAAERAVEIDPSLAEGHAALGSLAVTLDWNLSEGERQYNQALESNPNYASVHEWKGILYMLQGRMKEAMDEAQRALDLDPVSPAIHSLVAEIYYYTGEYDKAIEASRHILEVQPSYLQSRYYLGNSYLGKGMYPEAIEQFRIARDVSGHNAAMLMAYGYAQAVAGNSAEARGALQELEARRRTQYVPGYYLAGIYAGLNDFPNTLKYLNESYEIGNDRMPYLKLEPMVKKWQTTPEVQALIHKISLGSPLAK